MNVPRKSSSLVYVDEAPEANCFPHLSEVLIDVEGDKSKRTDVYALGFEEMVDLDAKNIMNTRCVRI